MSNQNRFVAAAIPLNRPSVAEFLLPPHTNARGTSIQIIGQRPTPAAERAWIERLRHADTPTARDLVAIDDPAGHLVATPTDRLVPTAFLREPDFLTRNLGGWAPIYFGVVELPQPMPGDPLLDQMEVLADYGDQIRYVGADPAQVTARLEQECGGDAAAVTQALMRLHRLREQAALEPQAYISQLYDTLRTGSRFATNDEPPIPELLLFDELMGQMIEQELERRDAVAEGRDDEAAAISDWQDKQRQRNGLHLILKGEYIMGRHRRSTVLIAPELGVVVKQPAPEPFHEAALSARTFKGQPENWPVLLGDGALVTPRGRLRLVIEENVVPLLGRVFSHEARLSALLGLIVEPFVRGNTVQQAVLADPNALTAELYDVFVLHQQACEALGVENGDWHAANFVQREDDRAVVHVDWGAARPLRPDEQTDAGRQARLDQVQNIAFSFHDETLAERVSQLHGDLLADSERREAITRRAKEFHHKGSVG